MRYWLFVVFASGCIHTIEEHESRVGDIERDCVVPIPAGVVELGAPVAIELPDASLWIWESLTLTDGSTIANAAARVPRDADACAQPPQLAVDIAHSVSVRGDVTELSSSPAPPRSRRASRVRLRPDGDDGTAAADRDAADAAGATPRSILALSPSEIADNGTRVDGRRLALVATGGFFHDGLAYLFYDHVLRGPGFFDAQVLGSGLCVLDPKSAGACERLGDPTILWRPDQRVMNRGGLVVDDRALVAGCRKVGSFDEPCTITGVPVSDVRDPSAYRVWDAFNGWVDPMTDASELTNTLGSLTIAPFDDGRFIATQLEVFDNRVVVQLSQRPEQSYGRRIHVFDVLPPADGTWFVSGGREHAGLRGDARTIVVSYATDHPDAPGLHLVEFRFYEGVE